MEKMKEITIFQTMDNRQQRTVISKGKETDEFHKRTNLTKLRKFAGQGAGRGKKMGD